MHGCEQGEHTVLCGEWDVARCHTFLQHFNQSVEIGFVDIHLFVSELHIWAFVLASAACELAHLIAQAAFKLRGIGLFKEGLHAFVSQQVFHELIHQGRHSGLLAEGFVEAVVSFGWQRCETKSSNKREEKIFHGCSLKRHLGGEIGAGLAAFGGGSGHDLAEINVGQRERDILGGLPSDENIFPVA